MKQKQLSPNETLFYLDRWMAMHQRLCWLILIAAAIGCAAGLTFTKGVPEVYGTAAMLAALLLLTCLYRWVSAAPVRFLRKWNQRLEQGNRAQYQELLGDVERLEKALPDGQRRQLNHSMTGMKASLMAALGQKEEALALLRNFDQYWDEAQRTGFQKLMRQISGENTEEEQKEN